MDPWKPELDMRESMDTWKREFGMHERRVWTRGNGNLTVALQDHSPVEENRYTCHSQL